LNLLRALALIPENGLTANDYGNASFIMSPYPTPGAEHLMLRGGCYSSAEPLFGAGVFAADLETARGENILTLGYRSVYVP
jgi:hypothetical protein